MSLHETTITVRYRADKDAPFQKLPAEVTFIGTEVGERKNGEPKVNVNGLSQDDFLADIAELVERDGVKAIADRYNHGADLRTRAAVRPAVGANGPSLTMRRQQTVAFVLGGNADEAATERVQNALKLSPKQCNAVLDDVYDEISDEMNI